MNVAGELPEHVAENRRYWDATADEWVAMGERAWGTDVATWGIWGVPDDDLGLLPADMTGMHAVELGCGTGYVSAWMARRGATVLAIDNSERQLATARRLAAEHGVDSITFVHGNAEVVDAEDASFDFAVSEYGVAIWADPYVWVPEAHRILRPGGELVMLGNTPLAMACVPMSGDTTSWTLQRPYFALRRLDWTEVEIDPGGMEFNMAISAWIKLFHRTGFEIVDYDELQAPADAAGVRFGMPADWARDYPAEQVWHLRKP